MKSGSWKIRRPAIGRVFPLIKLLLSLLFVVILVRDMVLIVAKLVESASSVMKQGNFRLSIDSLISRGTLLLN